MKLYQQSFNMGPLFTGIKDNAKLIIKKYNINIVKKKIIRNINKKCKFLIRRADLKK